MKLLNCLICNDIQALTMKERVCFCGKSKGKYLDQQNVIVFGPARTIGIRNDEYIDSLEKRDSKIDYKWFELPLKPVGA